MKRTFALLASLLIVACGSSSSDDGGSSTDAPEVKATKVAQDVDALATKIDDNCAANGTGEGGAFLFDPAKFDAAETMRAIKAEDKDKSGVDCSDQRTYSTSREDGVKLFREHLADKTEDTGTCLAENLSAEERKKLDALVSDPTNLGVFANVFAGGDNPEGCSYYEFKVFRKDGTRLDLVFNYTD
jgi:hypothetical protein